MHVNCSLEFFLSAANNVDSRSILSQRGRNVYQLPLVFEMKGTQSNPSASTRHNTHKTFNGEELAHIKSFHLYRCGISKWQKKLEMSE
jgi:hypothetical protein